MEKAERNYGIDTLRLVLMFMVCVLHTLGQGGVLSASAEGSLHYKVFWFIEIVSYCAVDGFALISGYTAVNKPRSFSKIVEMWFQAVFYSLAVTVLLTFFRSGSSISAAELVKCAFPVTFGKFWYFTAYFALFFAIPVLNQFVFSIDEVTAKKALILTVFLFSVMGLIADPFQSQWGYSAIWLMVLYCIGALSKKARLFEKRKGWFLIALWAVSVLLTWGIQVYMGIGRTTNYVSPAILLNAIIMVVLFSRLRLNGRVISRISPLAFGIYLLQLNQIVWNDILKNAFSFIASKNICVGVLYVFAFAFAIWAVGIAVEWIRKKLFGLIHIPAFSKKIVQLLDRIMTKLFVFLE